MARITIDYTPAVNQSAGIGRLPREVVRALPSANPPVLSLSKDGRASQDKTPRQFTLFTMGRAADAPPGFKSKSSFLSDRWFHRMWFRAGLRMPVEVFCGGCDLYYATDFLLPPTLPNTRRVLTVHDLTFERDPASAVPTLLTFLKRVVPDSVKRAHHIVADSRATARDLSELYAVPPQKITVIHSGVQPRFFADGKPAESPINQPFILTVGTMQKRKNHITLVRAFAKLLGMGLAPAPVLAIAGGKGWLYEDVLAEIKKLGIEDHVKFLGFVNDADLPALYRAARVFAFPSIYEGFGLPVLEAMAAGTPVVSSNASSLPEVVGDCGLMVNPLDVDGLAAALRTAWSDEAYRADVIPRAISRAKIFTWQKAAAQLMDVYERTLLT